MLVAHMGGPQMSMSLRLDGKMEAVSQSFHFIVSLNKWLTAQLPSPD